MQVLLLLSILSIVYNFKLNVHLHSYKKSGICFDQKHNDKIKNIQRKNAGVNIPNEEKNISTKHGNVSIYQIHSFIEKLEIIKEEEDKWDCGEIEWEV